MRKYSNIKWSRNKQISIILMLLISCKSDDQVKPKTFKILYTNDCIYNANKGIDSQVGEIVCNDLKINYDFGFVPISSTEIESKEDYINQKLWLYEIENKYLINTANISKDSLQKLIIIDSIDISNNIVYATVNKNKISHKFNIPEEISNVTSEIDTVNNQIVKIIIFKNNPNKMIFKFKKDQKPNSSKTTYGLTLSVFSKINLPLDFKKNFIKRVYILI